MTLPTAPLDIRVPSNTHPSHRPPNYGAALTGYNESADTITGSPQQPGRSMLESFAGSYSRASMLYMAENLTVPSMENLSRAASLLDSQHGVSDDEERLATVDTKGSDRMQFDALERTLSHPSVAGGCYHQFPSLSRHTTVGSVMTSYSGLGQVSEYVPRSNFIQSVFNAVNVLIGIGILALPLAFRLGGWLFGTMTFLFCAAATNYTAKLIARCLDVSPGACTYGDMGASAFNEKGRALVSGIFIVELMTIGVAMVVLLGDGLQSFWPSIDLITVRLLSFAILTPTLFLPMRKLAITSLIGIIACVALLVTVIANGLSKRTRPGSLWQPMDTEIIPADPSHIPLAFGLVMAGFSGHAVFPAIYRDMQDPKQYERMVDITYLVTVFAYLTMSVAGYTMFGAETMQEITQNLALTPEYNELITKVGIGLVVLTPIAKYGLMLNPINLTGELWLLGKPSIESWCKGSAWRTRVVTSTVRIAVSLIIVYIATVFPGFDRVVSLLGALFSFGISIIFPLACYRRLFGQLTPVGEMIFNDILLFISVVMAVVGTVWSFLPNDGV